MPIITVNDGPIQRKHPVEGHVRFKECFELRIFEFGITSARAKQDSQNVTWIGMHPWEPYAHLAPEKPGLSAPGLVRCIARSHASQAVILFRVT